MYSIDEFSVMFQISKKTLIYYDEIGLLKPAFCDENNKHRFYEKKQIAILKNVLKLKNIGISLNEIIKIIRSKNCENETKCYDKRLIEINDEVIRLEKQKSLIMKYKNFNKVFIPSFNIEEGKYINEGSVYYMKLNCEIEDIQKYIELFYEGARGIELIGSHIIKMNIDENSDSALEIFAYTTLGEGKNIRKQQRESCLKVECFDMNQKIDAYKELFNYVEKKNLIIKNIYESYQIIRGRMHVTIITSIL